MIATFQRTKCTFSKSSLAVKNVFRDSLTRFQHYFYQDFRVLMHKLTILLSWVVILEYISGVRENQLLKFLNFAILKKNSSRKIRLFANDDQILSILR